MTNLANGLKVSKAQAIGHLHMLWWWCIDYADDGQLDSFTAVQIASAMDWQGDAKDLIDQLLGSGFVDSEPLRVHDWLDFCGDLIKKRLEYRSNKRRRVKRLRNSLRKSEISQHTVTVPDRNHTEPTVPDIAPPAGAFKMIWEKYPRREGMKAAERHFKTSVTTHQDWLDIQNALENYTIQLRINRTEMQFTKMGSTWFNNWRDYVNYKVEAAATLKPIALPMSARIPDKEPTEEERKEILEMIDKRKATLAGGRKS